jgi:hypothetical protein
MKQDKLQFEIPSGVQKWSTIFMGIGLVAAIGGWIVDHTEHHQYWWANLLINGFFYFAVALGALFFYALQYATEAAWSAQLKRIFEAMYGYIPVGIGVIIVVLLAGQFHINHLYHWMDPDVHDVNSPHYDEIIANKKPYLSAWFFWLRILAYAGVFIYFSKKFREWSIQEDTVGGTDLHYMQYRKGAVFLVFFAVFSSTMSWDVLMSIDTHWYSTMYGWYIFSGMWVTTMIFATLALVWLKNLGYFGNVNDSHIHDMGKWVFAISMLWSYLWFCQYMLIWYSDIPEEVTYFQTRYEHYMALMWGIFFTNFALPFYVLVARDAKRNTKFLVRVGVILFISHFFDLYLAVIPGTNHAHETFTGWFELGLFIGFLGLFVRMFVTALSKANLIPVNHPFLNESEHHSI